MANAHVSTTFGKKNSNFSNVAGAERHARVARDSLRDLIMFNRTLEEETHRLLAEKKKGATIDQELLSKMTAAKDTYLGAMQALKESGDERSANAMIILADAIQDLMAYIHIERRH